MTSTSSLANLALFVPVRASGAQRPRPLVRAITASREVVHSGPAAFAECLRYALRSGVSLNSPPVRHHDSSRLSQLSFETETERSSCRITGTMDVPFITHVPCSAYLPFNDGSTQKATSSLLGAGARRGAQC